MRFAACLALVALCGCLGPGAAPETTKAIFDFHGVVWTRAVAAPQGDVCLAGTRVQEEGEPERVLARIGLDGSGFRLHRVLPGSGDLMGPLGFGVDGHGACVLAALREGNVLDVARVGADGTLRAPQRIATPAPASMVFSIHRDDAFVGFHDEVWRVNLSSGASERLGERFAVVEARHGVPALDGATLWLPGSSGPRAAPLDRSGKISSSAALPEGAWALGMRPAGAASFEAWIAPRDGVPARLAPLPSPVAGAGPATPWTPPATGPLIAPAGSDRLAVAWPWGEGATSAVDVRILDLRTGAWGPARVVGGQDVSGIPASGDASIAVHPLLLLSEPGRLRVVVGGPRPLDAPGPAIVALEAG